MNAADITCSCLQKEMLRAIRSQHPEWVEPDGASPICDLYEAKLAEILSLGPLAEGAALPLDRLGDP